jgi:ATP:ADP antiporter, AAA family
MFAAVFLTMAAYYMVKPAREGWIAVSAIGGLSRVEMKAYSSLVQSLLLIGAVGVYARFASRCSRQVLITCTSLACVAMLLAFWVVQPGFLWDVVPGAGIAFYLWVGMFGVFIVAQFWAFATDLYAEERGRRLLPLIAIGGTAGAAAGSWIHDALAGLGTAGAQSILVLATLPLLASAALSRVAAMEAPSCRSEAASPGFDLRRVLGDRFVLAAGVLALLLNWATTNGENLLFQLVQESLASADAGLDPALALTHTRVATSAFYGDLYFWTNLGALAVQLLVTARLLQRGGLAAVLLALPLLALLASALVALAPALAVLKWMKVAEQATDYSLNQTARQVLWLPASAEMKYESKPTVDTIFVRIGDGLAALTVLAASHVTGHATDVLLIVNLVLVALWLVTAMVLVREHGRLVAARAAEAGARAIRTVRRTARVVTRRVRRAARAGRAAVASIVPPWDVSIWRLGLLPVGRGHPPPGWRMAWQS